MNLSIVDQDLLVACCSERNANQHIEIGAEIFATELIFPEQQFAATLEKMGVQRGRCIAEIIVRLKRETRTTLSYAGVAKGATFMGFAVSSELDGVAWKKLEEKVYGDPHYKRLLLTVAQRTSY